MSNTTAKSHPCEQPHKLVSFRHFSWKIVTTLALMAAVITPAQAQNKGFSNVRINDVPLEIGTPDGSSYINAQTIYGTGADGRTFVFTVDLYNANGVAPDPINNIDSFVTLFSFQDSGDSTLPKPNNFGGFYEGNATLADPAVVSYTYNYDQDGVFAGALFAELFKEQIDYDKPDFFNPRGDGDGVFDTAGRGFLFTLVAEKPVTVPETTPTLGLIMLGACGVASQMKKIKLARKDIN